MSQRQLRPESLHAIYYSNTVKYFTVAPEGFAVEGLKKEMHLPLLQVDPRI
ncbi:MAG: hypothetical protein K8F53_12350 [Rhodocyclaceae bacterium]|nr:hypothetical protein [Rhodocyclaceae bacterium]